ncbi:MAG: hypothetical protein GXY61_05275 [Lentisphaerae bacterium]|nr:hypothetical protein [Lentisphaerota bacterium]
MNSKPYPKYKPSGVEWLGDVPEHWEVKRLKYCAPLVTTKAGNSGSNPIALENIESWTGRFIETESEFEGEGIRFQKDDVLFGKLRPYLAKVYLAETNGESVGDIFVLRPAEETTSKYLSNALRTNNYIEIIDGSTYGSKMPRASWEFMGCLPFLLPPLPEQQAIAAFLDRETGRIDALIAKKERLLELLAEQRTALISCVVTGKIDITTKEMNHGNHGRHGKGEKENFREFSAFRGYKKYKPSGVEWLGDVPEHWGVKALRYICRIETGDKDTVDAEDDGEYPFYVRSQTVERINSFTKNCEAVLTAGDGVGVGKVFHYYTGKFDFHQRVYLFSHFKKITGRFFFLFLKENFWRVALEGGAKSTVDSLRRPMIASFPFAIPPLPEQHAIAAYLDRETAKIDTLSAKVTTVIERLKEYRTALISSAVTGKIDVREAV